jgi:predicted RNase H-like HicB family nuclease
VICRVILIESDEGFAAFCPAIPGCCSQGATEAEALEMIADTITE